MAPKTEPLRAAILRQMVAALLVSMAFCGPITASQMAIDPGHHPWARFAEGTMVETRVITETLDAEGQVVSTSTTRRTTSLVARRDNRVTLNVVARVTVGGRRFEADPQVLELGLYDEAVDETFQLIDNADETGDVVIEGVSYPCRIIAFKQTRQGTEMTTRLFYRAGSRASRPAFGDDAESGNFETEPSPGDRTMQILALRVPYPWESRIFPAALRRDVQTHANGRTITLGWHSTSIPRRRFGCVFRQFDGEGVVVRRSLDRTRQGGHRQVTVPFQRLFSGSSAAIRQTRDRVPPAPLAGGRHDLPVLSEIAIMTRLPSARRRSSHYDQRCDRLWNHVR